MDKAPRLIWQELAITELVDLTPRVKRVRFERPADFVFQAGQHVDLRLTAPDGYQAQRSYSIASAPEELAAIELAIERLDEGEVSSFFHEVATAGDTIELRGPIGGHFVWSSAEPGPILLLGGGSGVVPLVSMVRHRAAVGAGTPMALVHSARERPELLYRNELAELAARGDGFHYLPTVTREPLVQDGIGSGRIGAALLGRALAALDRPPRACFVCGGNAFVSAVADLLLALDLPPANIRTERFGG